MKSGFILSMMSFFFLPIAFRRLSASPLEKPASFLAQQHDLLLVDRDAVGLLEVLLASVQIVGDRLLPCFRATKSGMYSIGPGRYKAFIAIKSAKTVGLSALRCFCMPADSYWKIPTVSPAGTTRRSWCRREETHRGRGRARDGSLTFLTASLMTVRVFSPKKSILSRPASSATALSNCVQAMALSLAVATGTKLVMSSGVMITPQAWMPVLRTLPSRMRAFEGFALERGFVLMALMAFDHRKSLLALTFSFSALSSELEHLPARCPAQAWPNGPHPPRAIP